MNTGKGIDRTHYEKCVKLDYMISQRTLTLIIRILQECIEKDYTPEELRSKIREILQLLGVVGL